MRCKRGRICWDASARRTLKLLLAIYRYPVKSLRGESLARAEIAPGGIPGDRAAALFVERGHARIGKAYRGKEDERLHRVGDLALALAAAEERGVALRRESAAPHYFDDSPLSLVLEPWRADAERICGRELDVRRFRPNLVADAIAGAERESDLIGAELRIGERVRLRVTKAIRRCVSITYDPERDAVDPGILRALAQEREATFGVYCEVLLPGDCAVGDSILRV
uniref:Putative MOSC domain containing protein n=1 Tax=mine drainage metagenome TaxID=410659 RepID=E6Q7I3_9ZZZZ